MIIYSKAGAQLYATDEFKYTGSFMSDRTISLTVNSPTVIDFLPNDYLDFRGERFVLDYVPTAKKVSSSGSAGNAFQYDLAFVSLRHELEKCAFNDVVLGDNLLHYTSLPDVAFTGDARMLAGRIQANLNRLYTGDNAWTVVVANDASTDIKNFSQSEGNCLSALAQVQSLYEMNFTIVNRTINIGAVGVIHNHVFEYGKGNGLYSINRVSVTDDAVVTRLRCYGAKENLPLKYKKGTGSLLPDAQYIPALMLPNYETTGIDYLDASDANKSIYGIREGIFKDETIKPSIKEMTGEMIRAAGGSSVTNGRVDVIVSSDMITDDDQGAFELTIPDIGFNPKNYLGDDTLMIEITDGRLGGVKLEVTAVIATTGGYKLTVNRNTDDTFALPDKVTYLSAGDHFVLTGLFMPDIYVKSAEVKLKTAGEAYLAEYDHAKATYAIGIDEIFMMSASVSESVVEGDLLKVKDEDLGVDQSIIIQQLNITYGGIIPKYEVTLSDTPVATTIDRIQDNITEVQIATLTTKKANAKLARANSMSLNKLKDYTFDSDTGKFRTENLQVGSIDALYLSTGVKSSNFTLIGNIKTNYLANPNSIAFTTSVLTHREIKHGEEDVSANYVWNIPSSIITLAVPTVAYYIYAKCSKISSTGSWYMSDAMLRYDEDIEYYYFRLGVVYAVEDGVRGESLDYGKSWLNGRFLTTGVIQSVLGKNGSYFDLDNNELRIGSGTTGLENFDEWADKQALIDANKDYINYVLPDKLSELQSQIDGQVISWFKEYNPSLTNLPTSEWTTDTLKQQHANDTFTNTLTGGSWRWQSVNGAWGWGEISDTATQAALKAAAAAKDTADGKRRVFVSQPTTPYDVGDLWVQGSAGDFMTCYTARESGAYVASDWAKASKYTDDTVANGIQVGGRNLLLNTNTTYAGWYNLEAWTVENGCIKGSNTTAGAQSNYISGALGKTYIISFNVISKSGEFRMHNGIGFDTEIALGENSFTFISTVDSIHVVFYGRGSGECLIKNIKLEIGNKATDWTPAPEDVQEDIDAANAAAATAQTAANTAQSTANSAQSSASTANSLLADIASDNKFTSTEKSETKKEWDSIVSEKTKNDSQADTFGVSRTTYDSAYSSLSTYITPLLTNLSTTSDIVGTTFRSTFKAYYDARTDLLNAIAAKAKSLADTAQSSANSASSAASSASSAASSAQSTANSAQTAAAAAQAAATALDYLKNALTGSTDISGGLAATNVLLLKNLNEAITGGMSGLSNDNIGMWTGGTYAEALAGTAKIIFYKDGSGRLANGGFVFNSDGDATFTGTTYADKGEIGGFEIASGRIGVSASYDSTGASGLALLNNFIKFSDSNTWAGIGTNVFASSSGLIGVGRFENNTSRASGINYGLYIKVTNAYHNLAIWAKGDIVTSSDVQGYGYTIIQPTGSGTYVSLPGNSNSTSKILIRAVFTAGTGFILPAKSTVQGKLGIGDNEFAVRTLILISADSAYSTNIYGRTTEVSGVNTSEYPYRLDANASAQLGALVMSKGDSVEFMLIYDGVHYYAYELNFNN